jgi:hypothetical protein
MVCCVVRETNVGPGGSAQTCYQHSADCNGREENFLQVRLLGPAGHLKTVKIGALTLGVGKGALRNIGRHATID